MTEALPHRGLPAIKRHFKRKFSVASGLELGWTEEEREDLKALVESRGRKWTDIGRLLGKLADECRHAYERIRWDSDDRDNKRRRFTVRENLKILKVLRKYFKTGVEKVVETPEIGLPWTAIAIKLENKRQAKDYERHWPSFRRHYIRELGVSGTIKDMKRALKALPKKSFVDFYTMKTDYPDFEVLQRLKRYDVDDYTGVLWGDLERDYNLPPKSLTSRWKYMESFVPEHITVFSDKVDHLLGMVDFFRNHKKPGYNAKFLANKALEVHLFNKYVLPHISNSGISDNNANGQDEKDCSEDDDNDLQIKSKRLVSSHTPREAASTVKSNKKDKIVTATTSLSVTPVVADKDDDNDNDNDSDFEWMNNAIRRPKKRARKL